MVDLSAKVALMGLPANFVVGYTAFMSVVMFFAIYPETHCSSYNTSQGTMAQLVSLD